MTNDTDAEALWDEGKVRQRQERKRWSDRFIPQCQQILAEWAKCSPDDIQIAGFDDDYRNATDLILPSGERVAVKTRRPEVLVRYPNEIALRHNPASPYPTEWQKVLRGKVQYLLYTYCDAAEETLIHWKLIDLWPMVIADLFGLPIANSEVHKDGSDVHLICFDLAELERCCSATLLDAATLHTAVVKS